ncbi:phosphatidylethanolamine/phosphatidyl-N-methylethanolamine N-methyltransferase [Natronospira proteinivora]|uniref:Phosphatidylethanolamine/phosphatidyl-N-methylethanolamine N-methyltransferase n=1 Tax=Natronospira proteinivora TaxID=1807133 RepID=A0ABT1G9M0_9GAMM|nr:methyltransferase domain-containing protein [Natronospira proteinivora]MCP1727023.1 phosphatidylethanolamine/phosphatidyl-N-methylethanolamine N-methyltransferase [Natronospira proteinivora]
MDIASIKSAYRRYARYYDRVFGPIFAPGRNMAIEQLDSQNGKRILEVGVGTGLSLPHYEDDTRIVGIDISSDMLNIARQRVQDENLGHVEALLEMDAENLSFEDNSFDAVIAMYVASVVPNPDRLMAEMARVCKPGGDLMVINHFASHNPLLRGMERGLTPLSRFVGFRPSMDLSELPQPQGFEQLGIYRANMMGYWKLVHYRHTGSAPSAPESKGNGAAHPSSSAHS